MSANQDASALAREANKALRNSQNAMFSGKLEKAQTDLDAAAELIEQIQALDPTFGQLKGLESKYAKQKKDLDRRLPKTGAIKSSAFSSTSARVIGFSNHPLAAIVRFLSLRPSFKVISMAHRQLRSGSSSFAKGKT